MCKKKEFVHLHVHSEYSTNPLDAINRIDTFPKYAKSLGQKAIALTDHGNMAGTFKFVKECRTQGIKPIVGLEAYYSVNRRDIKAKDDLDRAYYHLVLLAKNDNGLKNLIKLSSRAYTEGFFHKARIDYELLAEYSSDIIVTSACLASRVAKLYLAGRKTQAEKFLEKHAEIFPDRFYLELQPHLMEEQKIVNEGLIEISKRRGWPLVLTNDCHYMLKEDRGIHELALQMATGRSLDSSNFGELYLHIADYDWMYQKSIELNLPYEAISNTVHISNQIEDNYFYDIKNRYPKFINPQSTEPTWKQLEIVCKQKLLEKFDNNPPQIYVERLIHELTVIKKMGFSDYMLIVHEYITAVRDIDVWIGPGRGSAAGSLVSYLLNITMIDPIEYKLLFQRFLNPGRGSKPIIFSPQMIEQLEPQSQIKPIERTTERTTKRTTPTELTQGFIKCLNYGKS